MAKFDSKLEQKFSKLLDSCNIKWMNQFKIGKKRYDFYLPEYDLLVEIDGDYIHTNFNEGYFIDSRFKKKIIKNDALKNLMAEQAGYKLIRIWETDLNKMNSTNLKEILLNENKKR